jgi:hypothetical protein
MSFSLIPGFRAAWWIGAAEKREKRNDLEGVLRACGHVLAILDRPGVDVAAPWCRRAATEALCGYCRAGIQLGRRPEAMEMLSRWRDRYLAWLAAPLTVEEKEQLNWCEDVLGAPP